MLLNVLIAAYYHARTYPRTSIAGASVGNVQYGDIEKKAAQLNILPKELRLSYEDKTATVPLSELGIKADTARTKASLKQSRSWLPVVSLFTRHELAAPVTVDDIRLQARAETLIPTFHKVPEDAGLSLANGSFKPTPGKDGYDLSISKLKSSLVSGLDAGKKHITVPVTMKSPKYTTQDAQNDARKFQAQLATSITYQAGGKTIKPGPTDLINWYERSGATYVLSDFAIRTFIARAGANAGVRAANLTDAVAKSKQALSTQKALSFTLEPFATLKTYHYCTAVKGVEEQYAGSLQAMLKETYADLRGWGLDGQLVLLPAGADGACDFTVWLTRADLMPTFGAICDPEWSCRIGPNVVINFTRWQETSPAWKQSGGSVEDYRRMVINHETGHWFGFDHSTCPGSGQPAPVMMQQSISLGGCTFNPWPTRQELDVLKRSVGL
jgi:hypothetical protein